MSAWLYIYPRHTCTCVNVSSLPWESEQPAHAGCVPTGSFRGMRVSLGCENLGFPEMHKSPGEDDSKPGLMASLRLLCSHQTRSRNSSRSVSFAYSGLSLMVSECPLLTQGRVCGRGRGPHFPVKLTRQNSCPGVKGCDPGCKDLGWVPRCHRPHMPVAAYPIFFPMHLIFWFILSIF